MNGKNYRNVTVMYISMLGIMGAGAFLGVLYYVNQYSGSGDIKTYLDNIVSGMKNGADCMGIMLKTIRGRILLTAVICLCALVRPGIAGIGVIAGRQGFIYGFTHAAFIAEYGFGGVLITLSRLPAAVPAVLALAVWGAFNAALSVRIYDKGKKFKIFYIIFLLCIITTFCAASAAEGFIGTTFMKIIPVSVT